MLDQCTLMKLRCDGQSPCGSCQKRNLACNNQRTGGSNGSDEGTFPSSGMGYSGRLIQGIGTPANHETCSPSSSDRGSIKFLLNGGTESFTEGFRLPPRSDQTTSVEYHNELGLEDTSKNNLGRTGPEFGSGFTNSDPASQQFFQENFLDLYYSPLMYGRKPVDSPYDNGQLDYSAVMPPVQQPNFGLHADASAFEPERPFALALIQSILATAWQVPLDLKAQQEISANLNVLLTTARIRKFVSLYFECWHPSSSILHVYSFDPEAAPLTLLAAVVFMGAMYSNDHREVSIAKTVLDFAELFIYSSEVFSTESEVGRIFPSVECHKDESTEWMSFQSYQAGVIMMLTQYWAGSRVSRTRAMESRLSELVKVGRRMGLGKSRHLPEDQALEQLWIQKECRIRTACVVISIDCAFYFFQNFPCRLTQSEMQCDLPSDKSLFFSRHPFSEPNFRFARDVTLAKAFENLMDESSSTPMDLTVLDMFMLIHLLYSYINTHMPILGPVIRMSQVKQPIKPASDTLQEAYSIPNDPTLAPVKTALSRWRDHWFVLRNRVPSEEWAALGFYKNAYHFWLVSQLLITNGNVVDVVMQMEVPCEDKLDQLKVLLDDQGDV
ncbi:unnamed protein product [Penicillium olsonii]|nr:unnamed protein product [Penicillium olsonii]